MRVLPQTMTYVEVMQPGAPQQMRLVQGPLPTIGVDDVLLKTVAAGVNRPDVAQRKGAYPPPPGASPILGLEAAGEIVAVGSQVRQWLPGDRVCALTNGGGYAQYVAAPAGQCLPIPEGLSEVQAAALPETLFTVWSNVFRCAKLTAGDNFLVHGGSSGIGSIAIQLATVFGATVYATAGSAEKCRACEQLGAARAINYRTEDFVSVLKDLTDRRGMDVILDMVGGDYIQKNIHVAARDGRIVFISFLGGAAAKVDFTLVMVKRLILTGSTLRPRSPQEKAAIADDLRQRVWPLLQQGKIAPVIAAEFSLADVVAAHELMESSQHIGKIVLHLPT